MLTTFTAKCNQKKAEKKDFDSFHEDKKSRTLKMRPFYLFKTKDYLDTNILID